MGNKPGRRGLALRSGACITCTSNPKLPPGQQGWYYLFKEKVKTLGIEEVSGLESFIPTDRPGAKDKRIMGMESVYENGMFWTTHGNGEYSSRCHEQYPNGSTKGLLDVVGYWPQTLGMGSRAQARDVMARKT